MSVPHAPLGSITQVHPVSIIAQTVLILIW
jgi:hypothetical protein